MKQISKDWMEDIYLPKKCWGLLDSREQYSPPGLKKLAGDSEEGRLLLAWVVGHGDEQLAFLMCQTQMPYREGEKTALHIAASRGNLEVVKVLFENGFDLDQEDGLGLTPLHLAVMKGRKAVARFLLKKNADPNCKAGGTGTTPLHEAVLASPAMVRLLFRYNVTVDVRSEDHWGYTPLMWAVAQGETEIVSKLLREGADPNLASQGGFTPLQIATLRGQEEEYTLLRSHGAG